VVEVEVEVEVGVGVGVEAPALNDYPNRNGRNGTGSNGRTKTMLGRQIRRRIGVLAA